MNIKKKLAALACAALAAPALLAEGNSFTVDTTDAGAAVDAVGTALSGLITGKITQNVLTIVGAGLVIFAIFIGIRFMIRGGKTAAR